jgi:hypothetical protein
MAQDNKYRDDFDTDDLDNDIIRNEVKRVFKKHPHDYISKLEELGFEYYDDDGEDIEEQEEALARPKNPNQEYLVSCFDGDIPLSDRSVAIFLEERNSRTPNYPLLRKYFKSANTNLLAMVTHGLELDPVSNELLSDLAYFHGFQNQLNLLIKYYSQACEKQEDLNAFTELAKDFYEAVIPDGFNAYYALRDLFNSDTDRRKVVDFLVEVSEQAEDDAMKDLLF